MNKVVLSTLKSLAILAGAWFLFTWPIITVALFIIVFWDFFSRLTLDVLDSLHASGAMKKLKKDKHADVNLYYVLWSKENSKHNKFWAKALLK